MVQGDIFLNDRVEQIISEMTLDEKIGQMTQAERGSASPNDVRDYHLGSILSGGMACDSRRTCWQKCLHWPLYWQFRWRSLLPL